MCALLKVFNLKHVLPLLPFFETMACARVVATSPLHECTDEAKIYKRVWKNIQLKIAKDFVSYTSKIISTITGKFSSANRLLKTAWTDF